MRSSPATPPRAARAARAARAVRAVRAVRAARAVRAVSAVCAASAPVLALALLAFPLRAPAQDPASSPPSARPAPAREAHSWGLAVSGMGASAEVLHRGGIGLEAFATLWAERGWSARLEALSLATGSGGTGGECPAVPGAGCDTRAARWLGLLAVSATYAGGRDLRTAPYAILTLGQYVSWWGGGTSRPADPAEPIEDGEGAGPAGNVLGAGIGTALGRGRVAPRLELRGLTMLGFADRTPFLVVLSVGFAR